MSRDDPRGLGRGPLTRRLPVLLHTPAEPGRIRPFAAGAGTTPGRFLLRVIFSRKRVTVPAMLFATVWQVGEAAVPVVMGLAIDRALATGDTGQLALWLGVLVAVYVALTSAAKLALRLTAYAVQLLQHRLRGTLSAGVLHPVDGTGRTPDGGVVSLMTSDVARLANGVILVIMPVARIVAVGFIAASLLAMDRLLGLVVLIGAPVAVWSMGVLSERFSRDTREYQGLLASTVGRATDLVAGYRVVKGIGVEAEAEVTGRYRRASRETLAGAVRNAGFLGRFLAGSGAVTGVFVATVMGLAGWSAVAGRLSVGELIAAVGLTQALLPQIESIANMSIPNLAGARASAARLLDAVPAPPGLQETSRFEVAALPVLEMSVAGLRTPVRVGPGEFVGVHTDDRTAARLAAALLDPWAGDDPQVRLDGLPARELAPAAYRSRVTVAPHRVTLFSGTIGDNLSGDPAAFRAAACDDFATDPDAPVGEGGNRLSGGQRQRVALARALASDAPVLVLHDPTTAVDSVTEHVITGRLNDIRRGRSTLLLATAPGLLGACDRVVELLPETTP
ncbi:ABC transporter transmembrane domain-containing protein [Actinoplanes rectilineatus]|uniref:ABC transporter transmembrane domain-containing protein n=1 Tax=Actinoplanes rectilineatus TaxID=113571 RepID=UPI000B0D1343|nr:ABC transporter ATP-binding protein [Actinoplanes rectilineatus]